MKEMTKMTEVKNIGFKMKSPFTNPKAKGYDSWEEYWEANANGSFPKVCQNVDCDGKAEVCAHVKSVLGERKWYIVPLCKKCNHPTNTKTLTTGKMLGMVQTKSNEMRYS